MKPLDWDGKQGAGSGHSHRQERGRQDAARAKARVRRHLLCAGESERARTGALNDPGADDDGSEGGPLPEQADPRSLRRVLDIACGPGEWVMATAKTYPTMSLTGIDISRSMIQYAREQALTQHLEDRARFASWTPYSSSNFPRPSLIWSTCGVAWGSCAPGTGRR